MADVTELIPGEVVHLQMDQIARLADQVGDLTTGYAASIVIEDIVELLCAAETAWQTGEFQRLATVSRTLVGLAEDVGMETLSRVAMEVTAMSNSRDAVALAALVSRQSRVGEASLAAIWNLSTQRL